ncbi:MAG: hypothetical protein A3D31_18695 [Candidatus Fluviicola riflensis]|nr:MAG: hypothetical protein CHH17_03465 [Candidatus Fluviicola riflensis]OGS76476.1 MAG: hypothetical protein A3D31_18695 [Candidatus Fluviicola riflensis]OGS82770.1 MAG: hypothetical protein A2724_13520 [Fluviicola sp. RIFCSPHIGHO2_01_FULL_43_53]OGS89069.1 MAG: hypothetical protein A3E30_17180 [Fluviicola sp. RIFCSPHIGHO2_12_FULL_43_24]
MAETSKSIKKIYNWVLLLVVVALVVIVNIIGSFLYSRIDMTEDSRYSLSEGTISFIENKEHFKNRVLIKIYLEGNLPAEVKRFRNAVEDKLKEFKLYAGDRIEYEFIDPNQGNQADQDYLHEILYNKAKGIIPMNLVYTKDGTQNQLLLWPGAVIEYGGVTKDYVQLLPGTSAKNFFTLDANFNNQIQNSINNLEYMLISSIRRATLEEKPRIAFLQGHGELSYAETRRVRDLIDPYYTVEDITLNDSLAALDGVKGLIIARPRGPLSDKDKYIIDQFVMDGGRLMCFIDKLTFPADSLALNGMVHTTRTNLGGLERMLFDYGIKVNDNYLIDVRCAPKMVPMAKQSLIPWFFHIAATQTDHPISRNIDPVMLRYASELQFVGESPSRRATPVLTTSTNSAATGMAPLVSLMMPMNYGKNPVLTPNPESEANKKCLAGLVEGKFDSHFKNRIVESFAKNPDSHYKPKSTQEGKIMVVANGDFIRNYYDSMPSPRNPNVMQYRPIQFNNLRYDETMAQAGMQPIIYGNQEFFQNMVDYMMGDNSVLDIRSKHIDIHPIDPEKVKTDAGYYKVINLLIPSGTIILLALALFYLRKRRYARS